jgi:hypothetical protein
MIRYIINSLGILRLTKKQTKGHTFEVNQPKEHGIKF